MTDITSLQQQWQQELDSIMKDKAAAFDEKKVYDEKVAAVEERISARHGVKRITNPFVKATKLAWLHHKQNKFSRHMADNESDISEAAAKFLKSLGYTVAADSAQANEFNRLNTAIKQIRDTQGIVDSAASQCSSASSSEMFAGMNDSNKGMDLMASMNAQDAARAVRNAEQAVQNLQQQLKQELPQVNGTHADTISSSNNTTFMMDMVGGFMGTFANWDMSDKLDNAENHLRNVSSKLDNVINDLARQKQAIIDIELTQARKSDSAIDSFAATLQNYMLPAEMRAAPKKTGPRLIKK